MAEEKNNSNVGLRRFLTAQDGQRGDGIGARVITI